MRRRLTGWLGVLGLGGLAMILLIATWLTSAESLALSRPALPTARAGVSSKEESYQTPISKRSRTPTPAGSATSTPAPFATPLPPTPLPPPVAVPHSLVGKADCLYCHIGNTYFSVPADHKRRTNEMCLGCHSMSASAPRPTPRLVPHTAEGRENCMLCHLQGVAGAKPVPGDHAGRTNDTCRSCHRVK